MPRTYHARIFETTVRELWVAVEVADDENSDHAEEKLQAVKEQFDLSPAKPTTVRRVGNAFLAAGKKRLPDYQQCLKQETQTDV